VRRNQRDEHQPDDGVTREERTRRSGQQSRQRHRREADRKEPVKQAPGEIRDEKVIQGNLDARVDTHIVRRLAHATDTGGQFWRQVGRVKVRRTAPQPPTSLGQATIQLGNIGDQETAGITREVRCRAGVPPAAGDVRHEPDLDSPQGSEMC